MRDGACSSLWSRKTLPTSGHLIGLLIVGPSGPMALHSTPCGPQTNTVETPSVPTIAADVLELPFKLTAAIHADQLSNGLPANAATGIVTLSTMNCRTIWSPP